MSALVSPRVRGTRTRVVAISILAAVSMTTIVSLWSAASPAFADAHRFEIQSASLVGASSGKVLAPAVRLDPPERVAVVTPAVVAPAAVAPAVVVAVGDPPVPPVVNRSTCRSNLAGSVMTITIPDISYSCPVYAGGQKMLDSGAVTQITDESIRSVLADHPGGSGLLWTAAHRSSHGGAFAAVPNLNDGALITVSDGTYTATYRVVGRLYVAIRNDRVIDGSGNATSAATLDSIIRPDHGGQGASRLLLQTCDGENNRWMIYADLVTG
jgi:sortase (surface protein transpeptidase)